MRSASLPEAMSTKTKDAFVKRKDSGYPIGFP